MQATRLNQEQVWHSRDDNRWIRKAVKRIKSATFFQDSTRHGQGSGNNTTTTSVKLGTHVGGTDSAHVGTPRRTAHVQLHGEDEVFSWFDLMKMWSWSYGTQDYNSTVMVVYYCAEYRSDMSNNRTSEQSASVLNTSRGSLHPRSCSVTCKRELPKVFNYF